MSTTPISFTALGTLVGGIGLFLLGMTMLTDGLKLAAGRALERILAAWTRTSLHGLLTGVFLTALVQSSTAMTVATIGFVNAGLLTFSSALWVVFGSNLGSSFTGWLVAWLGFSLKVESFALPFIGVGMALQITGTGTRRGALGQAIAGFGVLFLGIELLRQGFVGLGPQALPPLDSSLSGLLIALLIGLGMTIVMQASSATLAVVLSAVAGGSLAVDVGAGMVIGANVGTTLTGILAAIKATANARRLAAAHVLFNVVTAVVAFVLIHPMLSLIESASIRLTGASNPVTQLVIYHTAFNALGVLLMWPLARPLARFLQARFHSAEEDAAQPRYLDANVLAVPHLAVQALHREMERYRHMAMQLATSVMRQIPLAGQPNGTLSQPTISATQWARQFKTTEQLHQQLGDFVSQLGHQPLTQDVSAQLPELLRIATYIDTAARLMAQIGMHLPQARTAQLQPASAEERTHLQQLHSAVTPCCEAALALFTAADPQSDTQDDAARLTDLAPLRDRFDADYEQAKRALLQAGANGHAPTAAVHEWVTQLSDLRRAVEQTHKAALRMEALPALSPAPALLPDEEKVSNLV